MEEKDFISTVSDILDKYDAQIVFWTLVPQTLDELRLFMCEQRISWFQHVLVKTLFNDGSGDVCVSFLIPRLCDDGSFEPEWNMSDYAKKQNMRITHFMRLPNPPVSTRGIE